MRNALAEDPEILALSFEYAPDAKFLVDGDGRIVRTNAIAEQMFGYPRSELVGERVEVLIPGRFIGRHVAYRSGYMDAPRIRPMGAGVELYARRKDGSELPVDIMLSPLRTLQGTIALAVVRDVTERKRTEALAREARETYLRELHHRVKNNLQIVSSLLYLQSTYTSDPGVLAILKESDARVRSIALIHEKLYRSPDLTRIDFPEYVRDLVTDLFRAYGAVDSAISIRLDVSVPTLQIDTAVPCGLIINELLSNVLKHAFPGGRRGTVALEMSETGPGKFLLVVRDDGAGLPVDFDQKRMGSLGLELVMDLARQLDGDVQVDGHQGTAFTVRFREVLYKERE